jgi:hypothetical protein
MEKPQIICHTEKSTSFSLLDCRWIPCSAKFVVLGSKPRGTGIINIYEISEGDVKLVKEVLYIPMSIYMLFFLFCTAAILMLLSVGS